MDCKTYDEQIQEAKRYFGLLQPDFAQLQDNRRAGRVRIGDTKEVILTIAAGGRPAEANPDNISKLTAREWNQKYRFWTLDREGQRLIVQPTGGVYRQWLGVGQKLGKCVAFRNPSPTQPSSPPLSPSITSHSTSESHLSSKAIGESDGLHSALADRFRKV